MSAFSKKVEIPYRTRDYETIFEIDITDSDIDSLLKYRYFNFDSKGKLIYVTFKSVSSITPEILNLLIECSSKVFKVKSLTFNYCEFKGFKSINSIFSYFKEVEVLTMNHVSISNLVHSSEELSEVNESIKTLEVINSDVDIDIHCLRNFKSLESLSYKNYKYKKLEFFTRKESDFLKTLKTIRLYNIDVDGFFKGCEKLDSVRELSMDSCSIDSMNKLLSKFKELKFLEIERVDWANASEDSTIEFPVNTLERLDISNCNMPVESLDLTNLEELLILKLFNIDISYINLKGNKAIYEMFFNKLKNLKDLNLTRNFYLKNLVVYNCRKLEDLVLNFNLNLENLAVKAVNLKELNLEPLTKLQSVRVNHTEVETLKIPFTLKAVNAVSYRNPNYPAFENLDIENNHHLSDVEVTVKYKLNRLISY